jgi:Holliday junction resolvase RusA-like endonuclease
MGDREGTGSESASAPVSKKSSIIIVLDGDPHPKGRPRFRSTATKTGKSFVSVYTDSKTRAFERALGMVARSAMRGKTPLTGPLQVSVTAFLAIPTSWSHKKRDAALAGSIRPGRPDADNIYKASTDPLNGIVFGDDAQIAEARIIKLYDENPRLRIEVAPIEVFQHDESEPNGG